MNMLYWCLGIGCVLWIVKGAFPRRRRERGPRIDVVEHLAPIRADLGGDEDVSALDEDDTQDYLRGDGYCDFDIVGESHYQGNLQRIAGKRGANGKRHRAEASLILEDDNPYDAKAVRVDIDRLTVGYLDREDARKYRRVLKSHGEERASKRCPAMVVGGWYKSRSDQGHYGVRLDIKLTIRRKSRSR